MLRKGIIDRQIESLGLVLAKVLGLKADSKAAEAQTLLRNTCRDLTGMDWNLVQSLTTESLLALLSTGGKLDAGKCSVIAVLLQEQGKWDEEYGLVPVARARYQKSFRLLSEALKQEELLRVPEFQTRLADMANRLMTPAENKDKTRSE